jgi:hypothetical protein
MMNTSNKSVLNSARCLQDIKTRSSRVGISYQESELAIKAFRDIKQDSSPPHSPNHQISPQGTLSQEWDLFQKWYLTIKDLKFNDPARKTAWEALRKKFNN